MTRLDAAAWQVITKAKGIRMDAAPLPRPMSASASQRGLVWLCSFMSADGARRVDVLFAAGDMGRTVPTAGNVLVDIVRDVASVMSPGDETEIGARLGRYLLKSDVPEGAPLKAAHARLNRAWLGFSDLIGEEFTREVRAAAGLF